MGNSMPIENISTQLTTLTDLEITAVKGLTCLPEGMLNNNNSLTYLDVHRCDELTCIALDVSDTVPLLEELSIDGCLSLESIRITQGIASLRQLMIYGCEGLSSLEFGLDYCTSLQKLEISCCPNLMSIPTTQGMPSLRKLMIEECEGLSSLGSGISFCTSLQELEIKGCDNLTSIPITQGMPSLRSLKICYCEELSRLGSGISFCTSLQELEIKGCDNLTSIPITQGITSLRSLNISFNQRLLNLPSGLQFCTSLQELGIGPLWEEDRFRSSSDYQQRKRRRLISLWTPNMAMEPENLIGLEALPEWLGNLTSLEALSIYYCENLKYLPTINAMKNLTKLKQLDIRGCPLLKERCTKETGPEWPKISHIPDLRF
ncbi:putative adenylate cyclase regulatory protein [Rosa chinensis]|uniref:putative adenylate cyclase regulatory protein n=1 Tax=Rosa chinensis TaxID=74649 RepID=UPI000D08E9E1|nr:putative adenylate cyclase regulatory protein [Rosa chinensis]